jgi:hypothetical protein
MAKNNTRKELTEPRLHPQTGGAMDHRQGATQ